MLNFGKKALLAISLGALTLSGTMAVAQPGPDHHDRGPGDHHPGGPGGPGFDHRPGPGGAGNWHSNDRNWKNWRNYDYNRFERGGSGYYAENYYRGGYRPIRVTRETRIYRGNNGNYYCRRSDGTTGLIVGAAIGGLIGNSVSRGGSGLLGTLLGAGAGGAIGSSIDRGNVTCR